MPQFKFFLATFASLCADILSDHGFAGWVHIATAVVEQAAVIWAFTGTPPF